jgi:hypothetical protein
MQAELFALVMRVWGAMHALPDETIAQAIASACAQAYVFDRPLLAGTMAVYAVRESGISMHPIAWSHDALDGTSCGVWQEPCKIARFWNASEQAHWWVRNVVRYGLAAIDSDARRARERIEIAGKLMAKENPTSHH